MTKEEKLALASTISEAVIKALKENNMKMDINNISGTVEKVLSEKSCPVSSTSICSDANDKAIYDISNENKENILKASIGLTLYGADTRVLSEDFIRTYSSGKLDSYSSCSYFLNQKYLKEKFNGGFNDCIKSNPAYFTYLELSTPVVNPFFIQSGNNILSILLDIPVNELKDVVNYEKYVITKSNEQYWRPNDIVHSKHYYELKEQNFKLEFATGGEAIKHLLSNFDPSTVLKELKKEYLDKGKNISQKIQKRIDVLEYFIYNKIDVQNILISVLPMPQVEELLKNVAKQTRTEVKNMYLIVADTSERVIDLVDMNTPQIIVNNQKRLLQEAVDRLFRKILKVFLCQTNMQYLDSKDKDGSDILIKERKDALFSLFGTTKGSDVYNWIHFISMLFCLEIIADSISPSSLYDFLWEHNSVEDKDVWDHLSAHKR